MEGAVEGFEEVPENRGGYVAYDGAVAAGKYGGHEAFTDAMRWVSEGVDALVDAVKLSFADTDRKGFRPQPARLELSSRDRPMLPGGDIRRSSIGGVEFYVHMDA